MRATFSPFDPRTRGLNDLLVRVQAARKQDGDAKTEVTADVRRGAKPSFVVEYDDGRRLEFDGVASNVVRTVLKSLDQEQRLESLRKARAKKKEAMPKWHSLKQPSWRLLDALKRDPRMLHESNATAVIWAQEGELAGKKMGDVNADGLHYFSPWLRGDVEGPPPRRKKVSKVPKA